MREILGLTVYTVKETAEMLGTTTTTIHNYIKRGQLPARKIAGVYHITADNIKQYVKGHPFTDPVTGELQPPELHVN